MDEKLVDQLYGLIRSATTDLPADVEDALREAKGKEPEGSTAKNAFGAILENVAMAREKVTPICQDTGMMIFYVYHPVGTDTLAFRDAIEEAVRRTTSDILMRPNAVDIITGKNTGNNTGTNAPFISFKPWKKDEVRVKLMLKGGGSENVGAQYKLPDAALGAGRDLDGVRRCVLDAVFKAQGMGCAPGVIGIGVGGDRASSYLLSKEQFFREIGSVHEDRDLAKMGDDLHRDLNKLGIGPMGFGGATTVLDVFIGVQHRHPATFYVAVSYMCWANRRKEMSLKNGEAVHD